MHSDLTEVTPGTDKEEVEINFSLSIKLSQFSILMGHFGKYHNTLCLYRQMLHKHCFQFLLGLAMVPGENKHNAYAKFGVTNKEYYGIFQNGLFQYYGELKIFNLPTLSFV